MPTDHQLAPIPLHVTSSVPNLPPLSILPIALLLPISVQYFSQHLILVSHLTIHRSVVSISLFYISFDSLLKLVMQRIPGVGLVVWVVGLRSEDPEFKSHLAVEVIAGGVDSACHPSEVGKMSASLLVSCVGVATRPGLCPIAKETA